MVPFRIHWATSHIEKELSALHTEEAAAKGRIGQENAARAIKGKSEKVRGAEKVVQFTRERLSGLVDGKRVVRS